VELPDGTFAKEEFPVIEGRMIRHRIRQGELGKSFPRVIGLEPLFHVSECAILMQMFRENRTDHGFNGDGRSAEGIADSALYPVVSVGLDEGNQEIGHAVQDGINL